MKKFGLFLTFGLAAIALTGCSCNNENDSTTPNEAKEFCLERGGTYSQVTSPDEEYGECMFPSGIGCRDDLVLAGECSYEPDLSNIDTEEKRLAGCKENVEGWMNDFVQGAENVDIQWGEESEGGASFVRNGVVKYTKDGTNYTMNAECMADFVDGSISVSYGDEVADE